MRIVAFVLLILALQLVEGTTSRNTYQATAKHRSSVKCKETNRPITQFLSSLSTNYDVFRAETLWTLYVVDNNMPFTSSDGFCDVVKTIFPDSKIAQDFACRRTKTTSIART